MVKLNAKTDVVERTMKAGHVMKVDLMPDETGRIQQHGQSKGRSNVTVRHAVEALSRCGSVRTGLKAAQHLAFVWNNDTKRDGTLEITIFVVCFSKSC